MTKEEQHTELLKDYEVKIIRIVEKMDNLTSSCERVSARIDKDMVTHDRLKLVQQELCSLQKELGKVSEGHTWLWRGMFGAMLSAAATMFVFMVQKGS